MQKIYVVQLSSEEREQLQELVKKGNSKKGQPPSAFEAYQSPNSAQSRSGQKRSGVHRRRDCRGFGCFAQDRFQYS